MVDPAAVRIVVIVGPTGAGKTALALDLAGRVSAEIVSIDSQQVYRGMDIGTGKATTAERRAVRHHLIDVLDPDEQMTAARYVERADVAIADIAGRGLPVVVVGGTGLYVRALLFGLFQGPPADPVLRATYAAEAERLGSPLPLWERLQEVDPDASCRINPNDLVRISRALEVYDKTGIPMSVHQRQHDHTRVPMRYAARLVGLSPDRELLYEQIGVRVDAMMAAGLLAEVEGLRAAGYRPPMRSQAAIAYPELHAYLDGTFDLEEAVRLIKRNSRRYARRQLGWYRDDKNVTWYGEASQVDLDELGRYLVGSSS